MVPSGPYAGYVYIGELGTHIIDTINPQTNTLGQTILDIVNSGTPPSGLAAFPPSAGDDTIFVTSASGRKIEKFTPGDTLTDDIQNIGSAPSALATYPGGPDGDVFVADSVSNVIYQLDSATGSIAIRSVGASPRGIAVSPVGVRAGTVYVANFGDNTVSVVDPSGSHATTTIPVGTSPFGVAAAPVGPEAGDIYVTNFGDNTVSVIDTATNTISHTISVGSAPSAVVVSPFTGYVYVANQGSNTVSVIDPATNLVVASVPVGASPVALAISPAGPNAGTVYVGNSGDSTVSILPTPVITSDNAARFTVASMGTFTITATGTPAPSLAIDTALPSGLTFTDNGDGTATISGTPADGTAGTYPVTVTASNSLGQTTQSFTLTVKSQYVGCSVQDLADAITDVGYTPGTLTLTAGCTYDFTEKPALAPLKIDNGMDITINGNGATIENSSGPFVIETQGVLHLSDVTLTENHGAIWNDGSFTLSNSVINHNRWTSTSGIGLGGVIYSTGSLTVTGTTFTNNGIDGYRGAGGAIYASGPLTISGSTFDNNSVMGGGGAIAVSGPQASITDSTFTNNQSPEYLGIGDGWGGAIETYGAELTIKDSVFSGNTAVRGGAIYDANAVSVLSSTFSGNTATQYGGAIYTGTTAAATTLSASNSTFASNTASTAGGAIYGYTNSQVTTVHDTFSGNIATSASSGVIHFLGAWTAGYNIYIGNGPSGCQTVGGTQDDLGYSVSDTGYYCTTSEAGTNVAGTAAGLLPLANNGGPTPTMAITSVSAAYGLVPAADCPATDQRGATRIEDAATHCDTGAFEANASIADGTVTVTVSGTGAAGSEPALSFTPTDAPVEGSLTCATADGGAALASLAAGSHTVDGASCSGLTATDGTSAVVYTALPGGLAVSGQPSAQTITFDSAPPTGATVNGSYEVKAHADSGLQVVLSVAPVSSAVCTLGNQGFVSGQTSAVVSFDAKGLCTINADQPGDGQYAAATTATQAIAVAGKPQTIQFSSPAAGAVNVGDTYSLAAGTTSALQIDLAIDPSSTSVCSLGDFNYQSGASSATVTFNAGGTCTINANQAGDATWAAAAQQQMVITVSPISLAPASLNNGMVGQAYPRTSISASGGDAPYVYALTAGSLPTGMTLGTDGVLSGTPMAAGQFTFTVTATDSHSPTQAGSRDYTLTIAKGVVSVSAVHPFGASTATFSYTPADAYTGVLQCSQIQSPVGPNAISLYAAVPPGTYAIITGSCNGLSVVDTANYELRYGTGTLTVTKADQSIAFQSTAPSNASVGHLPPYSVSVSSSSYLEVSLSIDASSADVCAMTTPAYDSGSGWSTATVTFTGAGTCTVNADQSGNDNYNAATRVQQTFAVGKGTQVINFNSGAPGAAKVGGGYTVEATSGSKLQIAFTSEDTSVCTVGTPAYDASAGQTSAPVAFVAAGTCVIDANQPGDANYNAASQQQQSFTITRQFQGIYWDSSAPSGGMVGGTYSAQAHSTSGLEVTLSIDPASTGVCSITTSNFDSSSTVTTAAVSFDGKGDCKIEASQAGDETYAAATPLQASITVNAAIVTVTVSGSQVYGGTPTFTQTNDAPVAVTLDVSQLTCAKVTSGAITSMLDVANYTIDASSCGGVTTSNPNYTVDYVAGTSTFAVTPATLAVTVTGSQTYGGDPAFEFSPNTGVSGSPICGSVNNGTAIASTLSANGTYTIDPSSCTGLTPDANHRLSLVGGTFQVAPAMLTITADNQVIAFGGTPVFSVSYSAFANQESSSVLSGTLSCTVKDAGAQVVDPSTAAPGSYTIDCSGLTGANYQVTYAPGVLTVNPAPPSSCADNGSTCYVALSGNDATGDGTQAHPFRTIQAAVNATGSGGVVVVGPGTYNESVQVTKPVSLRGAGYGQDPAGYSGPKTIVSAAGIGEGDAFDVETDGAVSVDGFRFQYNNAAIDIKDTGEGSAFKDNVFFENAQGMRVTGDVSGITIATSTFYWDRNRAYPNSGYGIVINGSLSASTIDGNRFSGVDQAAIRFWPTGDDPAANTDVIISNNTATGDGAFAILENYTHDTASCAGPEFEDALICGNTAIQTLGDAIVIGAGSHGFSIVDNTISRGNGAAIAQTGADSNGIGVFNNLLSANMYGLDLRAGNAQGSSVVGNRIVSNRTAGLDIGANFDATGLTVTANTFQSNHAGVTNSSVAFGATCNWWGSATGPRTPTNPGGWGDTVTGLTRPDYQPWLTTADTSGPCDHVAPTISVAFAGQTYTASPGSVVRLPLSGPFGSFPVKPTCFDTSGSANSGVASCTTSSSSVVIYPGSARAGSFTVTARDKAGNTSTVTINWTT